MNRDWMVDAACRDHDPELWFHISVGRSRGEVARMRADSDEMKAKTICAACPVLDTCLRDAMQSETQTTRFGIWGGLNPAERRAMARASGVIPVAPCGSARGYRRHLRAAETPCTPCRAANAAAAAEQRRVNLTQEKAS